MYRGLGVGHEYFSAEKSLDPAFIFVWSTIIHFSSKMNFPDLDSTIFVLKNMSPSSQMLGKSEEVHFFHTL
jgi:hypothetical protein